MSILSTSTKNKFHPIRNMVHFTNNILMFEQYQLVTVEEVILLVKPYRQ
jgi:hypothetical protein